MIILLDVLQRNEQATLVLNNLTGIEYSEASGELAFIGDSTAKTVYLDKGTSQHEVWKEIRKVLAPAQEGRAVHVPVILLTLDLARFQTSGAN